MNEHDKYKKTIELVERFKNGEQMYSKSALFNMIIQMLVRGEDVYHVIEQLILITQDSQEALLQYMQQNPLPRDASVMREE